MDDTMAPPSKRRKLLDAVEAPAQPSESARTFIAPFSHGVEHIPASQPTQAPIARSPPHHVEEVHLQIHKRSSLSAEDRLRLLKRQGTAALTDIIKTNSDADVVVAVTASADALGSTTALATAAVTVDLPDVGSLLSTSSSTTVISESSSRPASSTSPASSAEPSSSERSSPSQTASSSDDSRSSSTPSSTANSRSSTPTSSGSQQTYAISPASESSDDDAQSQSLSSTSTRSSSTESGTRSSSVLSSTATDASESSTALSSSALSSQIASLSAYASSNSSMLATSSGSSASAATSGYLSSTGSSSMINSLNLTTSASTSTSGSAVLVSVVTVSSTSSSDSQATDSSSSIDLNALYLATQSNGDVTTITKSDEPFTTSLADGQAATIPASSSGSVTVISSGGSTVRSTVFSTASPSPTQSSSSSSDDPNGVGLAGVAGDGATATSGGISSTSAPAKSNGGDDNTAPAGTIAGGVVGGAAGLVLVGLIILLFLRRYKKRIQLGHQALPANTAGPLAGSDAGASSSGQPGMAERAGLMPFAGAVPALFRHQNRQSGAETGERGFQRVSGRKLPSAFSEGMAGPPHPPTSPPPTMPLVSPEDREGNVSGLSFYRDSAGFYGGDGSSPSPNPFSDTNIPATVAKNEAAEQLIMSPGPQRRPTIHAAKPNVQAPSVATSGTPSWTPSHTATFARSDTPASLDSGRNSRFTEEV